jgi:hypothetical protein
MKNACAAILVIITLIINLTITCFLSFVIWVYCDWMIDDSMAAHMSPIDWACIACERLFWGFVLAVFVGVLLSIINRLIYSLLFPRHKRLNWFLAGTAGFVIAIAAIIGSIQFYIEKPFM